MGADSQCLIHVRVLLHIAQCVSKDERDETRDLDDHEQGPDNEKSRDVVEVL